MYYFTNMLHQSGELRSIVVCVLGGGGEILRGNCVHGGVGPIRLGFVVVPYKESSGCC